MDFDAELIHALQEDGRASIRSLSERLGHSRAVVGDRLRTMLADRTVRVVAAVDPGFLGQHVLAHVSVRTEGPVESVAGALRDLSETVFVSAVGGSHQLVIEVRIGSTSELHELLAEIRAFDGVAAIDTNIYASVVKGFYVSEYRGDIVLDTIDEALIDHLQRDGRTSFRALGEAVRLSPSAVTARVRKLVDSGVITISAVEGRGLTHRQLSMGIGLTLSSDSEVIDALRADRGVDFVARTVGRFDAIATLVESSAGALHARLEHIRAHPGVKGIEGWLHLAVVKEDYARTLRDPRITV